MLNYVKMLVIALACRSALVCLLAPDAFTAQGVNPDGTRVTFIGPSRPDGREQSNSARVSPDSGSLTL